MRGQDSSIALRTIFVILMMPLFAGIVYAASRGAVLHSFNGTDGYSPWAGLALDAAGNLYGTTIQGGNYHWGAVFEMSPNTDGSWTEIILHSFNRNENDTDGQVPAAGLIFDAAGNIYGTTAYGGPNAGGTVFELSRQSGGGWAETVLHSFGGGTDGYNPESALIFDVAGNLYGTTVNGGTYNCGTVFELTPAENGSWAEGVLYSFGNGSNGCLPGPGLIFDAAGNLYGTTGIGGTYDCGTVFQLTHSVGGGWAQSVLHTFSNNEKDGCGPDAGLIFDAAGNLFGTTYWGGAYGCGTVFGLRPNASGKWEEGLLHSFNDSADGCRPRSALLLDAAGNFLGTTASGGTYGYGTVFGLRPKLKGGDAEIVLHSFDKDSENGAEPYAGLISDSMGNLYGTTSRGGAYDAGTVYEVKQGTGEAKVNW